MRPLTSLVVCGICAFTTGHAQAPAGHAGDAVAQAYNTHRDAHFGHGHIYPDRGSIVRELPSGAVGLNYAGVSYRFSEGVWYEPRGVGYMVVTPPIGLVVPTLPQFVTPISSAGQTYLYANDTYYRARPDLGGYEVVNDPADSTLPAGPSSSPLSGGVLPSQVPVPITAYNGDPAGAMAAGAPAAAVAASVTPPAALGVAAVVPATLAVPTEQAVLSTQGSAAAGSAAVPKAYIYPKNGQTPEQQERDRYECYRFATAQTGFDPMHSGSATAAVSTDARAEYERAQSACFDAKGYTTR
jgi:hypothetical protein